MYEPIIESGMHFDNTDVWRIEKSALYTSLSKGNDGFKVVEFIRVKDEIIYLWKLRVASHICTILIV